MISDSSTMPTASSFLDHSIEKLEHALSLRKRIDVLQKSLGDLLGGVTGKVTKSIATKVDGRKGKRSAASRAKMAAAQKARWAKKRTATSPAAVSKAKTPRKKRTMSPEGRAKIAAAQKARWAKSRK